MHPGDKDGKKKKKDHGGGIIMLRWKIWGAWIIAIIHKGREDGYTEWASINPNMIEKLESLDSPCRSLPASIPQNYNYLRESNWEKQLMSLMKIQIASVGAFWHVVPLSFCVTPAGMRKSRQLLCQNESPVLPLTRSPFTHWQRAQDWKGVFHH